MILPLKIQQEKLWNSECYVLEIEQKKNRLQIVHINVFYRNGYFIAKKRRDVFI